MEVSGLFPATLATIYAFGFATASILFATAVARDSKTVLKEAGTCTLAGRGTWILATLLGGVFVAAAYWLVHYSTLKISPDNEAPRAV
jgi:hypothetical protein